MLSGAGGQGLVLMTRIISQAALRGNYDVKSNDVVGLSQRGGMVSGNVRFGEKVYSPNIPPGEGDILVSMEPLEALRWSAVLKKDGVIIMNTKPFYPTAVQQEQAYYPVEEIEKLKNSYRTIAINAFEEAVKIGKKQVSNIMLLGALARFLNIKQQIWEETIADNVPNKSLEMNLHAFNFGYNMVLH
ncbi:MAG: pyruvate ferredoxin/flavodoxin oxidoreductase [Clostridia bacterium]|jgi:indolepyruvate ferredoxin oxidoreductase beta subunit|nr:pyruvate ferredoxin/flavodoxin oxidoreductase [Clostridia bacterium]